MNDNDDLIIPRGLATEIRAKTREWRTRRGIPHETTDGQLGRANERRRLRALRARRRG